MRKSVFLFGLFILAFSGQPLYCGAQEQPVLQGEAKQSNSTQTFNLNIPYRRIQQPNLQASTALKVNPDDSNKVYLFSGTGIQAEQTDIHLHNVTGRVNFRTITGNKYPNLNLQLESSDNIP